MPRTQKESSEQPKRSSYSQDDRRPHRPSANVTMIHTNKHSTNTRESTRPHRAVLKSPEHLQHISTQGFRLAPINRGSWTNSGQENKLASNGSHQKTTAEGQNLRKVVMAMTTARINSIEVVKENRRYFTQGVSCRQKKLLLFYDLQALINPRYEPELNHLLFKQRPRFMPNKSFH